MLVAEFGFSLCRNWTRITSCKIKGKLEWIIQESFYIWCFHYNVRSAEILTIGKGPGRIRIQWSTDNWQSIRYHEQDRWIVKSNFESFWSISICPPSSEFSGLCYHHNGIVSKTQTNVTNTLSTNDFKLFSIVPSWTKNLCSFSSSSLSVLCIIYLSNRDESGQRWKSNDSFHSTQQLLLTMEFIFSHWLTFYIKITILHIKRFFFKRFAAVLL